MRVAVCFEDLQRAVLALERPYMDHKGNVDLMKFSTEAPERFREYARVRRALVDEKKRVAR